MKKLALAAVLILVCAMPSFANGLSPDDVEEALTSALAKSGYQCTVVIKDYDKDGIPDIGITYISGSENQTVATLLGGITGGVAVLTDGLSWKCDKVLLVLNKKKGWHTTASACRNCWKKYGNASDEELGKCVLDIWTEEDI